MWPHAEYPPIEIGVLELNRNAENYFAEIEQVAFSPSNIVPGIGHSPDKMLQARVFSYADAHRYRLGTHYEALPVNAPKCPVHHYHRDGQMNFYGGIKTGNPEAYYEPNSFNGPAEDKSVQEPPLKISAMPTGTTTGKAMTISASRGPCSTCSTKGRKSGCSPISPQRWAMLPTRSRNVSASCSTRFTLSMAQACGLPWRPARRSVPQPSRPLNKLSLLRTIFWARLA